MKYSIIKNLPKNPKILLDRAKDVCYDFYIDEFGTNKNPDVTTRKKNDLSYDDAFNYIKNNISHFVISFRNDSYFNINAKDYWEFSYSNISSKNEQ